MLARPSNADTDHELRLVHGDIPTAGVVPGRSPKRAIAPIKIVVLGVAAKRVGKLLARYHVVQGPFTPIARRNLFQLRRDRGKRRVEFGPEALDDADNGHGNAGRDQAIFDGGRAGLVFQESVKLPHHAQFVDDKF